MNKEYLITGLLKVLHASGLTALWEKRSDARGAILCFHHVKPNGGIKTTFSPNYQLEISPEFLEALILHLKSKNYRFIAMADVPGELSCPKPARPFAVFTFDDGFRDNAFYAAPVLRKHNVPYTIYLSQKITDGTCELWWQALEVLIQKNTKLDLEISGTSVHFDTSTDDKKAICANVLFPIVKDLDEHAQRVWIRDVAAENQIDLDKLCRDAAMGWDEIKALTQDPLCTFGAHTLNHFAVAKLSAADARMEIAGSRESVSRQLQKPVAHFAYPYGDRIAAGPRDFQIAREAGFETAVTTRKGLVFEEHKNHLHALPRLMVSGRYQNIAMFDALLSGLPFALLNRFRNVDVA